MSTGFTRGISTEGRGGFYGDPLRRRQSSKTGACSELNRNVHATDLRVAPAMKRRCALEGHVDRTSRVASASIGGDGVAGGSGADARIASRAGERSDAGGAHAPTGERPRVLMVDDQRCMVDVLKWTLTSQLEVEFHACFDSTSALDAARAFEPTVILQDLVMPDADGFAMLRRYRLDPVLRDVPVIVLSSREHPRDKSRAFELGASDYLVKIPDPIELAARVRSHSRSYLTRCQRDVAFRQLAALKTQLELKNAELERVAAHDGLTGLANRRRFDESLEMELRRALRDRTELSLILADVDHFKRFNDRYGHVAGDECLRRVADGLRACARRATDVAARYGGEEFAVLLPSTPREAACSLAEAMRRRVADLAVPHEASDVASHVTLSLGVASMRPGVVISSADLIEWADRGLYLAKRSGRNRRAVSPDAERAEGTACGQPA